MTTSSTGLDFARHDRIFHCAFKTSINASCGILIFPMLFIRFFLFLFLEQFPLAGDIAAVAFRGLRFFATPNALTRNNFPPMAAWMATW